MSGESAADQPSSEELARRAQQGCTSSLEQLLRRYQVPVLRFLRHRGARADAEDLLQETFLRVCANLHRYSRLWRFDTWLFTIARRVSINSARRPRPSADEQALQSFEADGAGPAESAIESDRRRQLWSAAARILSEQETGALWLHYVEGLSLRQVAAVLGCSWSAVKVQIFRARKRLMPELRRLGYDSIEVCRLPDKSDDQPVEV